MEQKILELIEVYEEQVRWLKSITEDETKRLHANISAVAYKRVIQDLRKLVDKTKHENNL